MAWSAIFASAVATYIATHLAASRIIGRQALSGLAQAHGYDTAFWWIAGIFAAGAVVSVVVLRPGPQSQIRADSVTSSDGATRRAEEAVPSS